MSTSTTPHLPTLTDFVVLSRMGQGGMGVVYRARQLSLGREVALKCLTHSDDPASEVRFSREIHALGRVTHPHLVKVYAAGTEGGHWYYAMELIEGADMASITAQLRASGKPLSGLTTDDWLVALERAERLGRSAEVPLIKVESPAAGGGTVAGSSPSSGSGLPPPVREDGDYVRHVAELVRQVAEATHALHEAGIVHRDIKPGNVMIRPDGAHAVLMDLGLAHIRDDATSRLTRTRQFVGTLRYASPEQVLAVGPVDERSDVYSLGATLWELLTLQSIFGGEEESSTYDLMRRIEYEDPPSVRRYHRRVPVDLAAIVSKCLEKNPSRRYETAAELVRDLDAFLHERPVVARPLGRLQRLENMLARYPLPSAVAFLLVIAVLLAVGIYWKSRDVAKQHRYIEQLNAANARADASFRDAVTALDAIFQLVSEGELRNRADLQPLRQQLLQYYEQYIERRAKDAHTELELALAHERLARITADIGDRQQAVRQYTQALKIIQGVLTRAPRDETGRQALGRIHNYRANLLIEQREYLSAETDLEEAERELTADGLEASSQAQRLLAETHHTRGILRMESGRMTDSLGAFLQGLAIREQLVAKERSRVHLRDLGRSFGYLGDVQLELGDYQGAEDSYTRSMQLREELVKSKPDDDEARFQLARAYRNLGHLHQLQDDLDAALRWFQRAVAQDRDLVRDFPSVTDYQGDLGEYGTVLGELLVSQGDPESARPLLEETANTNLALLARNPADMRALSCAIQANVYLAKAELSVAPESARRRLETGRELVARLKEPTAADLYHEALLTSLSAIANIPAGSPAVLPPPTQTEVATLLARASQRNQHTIAPRLKREPLFDAVLIASPSELAAGSGERGAQPLAPRGVPPRTLYALTVGISDYQIDALDLAYGAADATALADVLRLQTPHFDQVVVETLTDRRATRAEILQMLTDVRQQISESSLLVLTLSGHGLMNNLGEYYFAPHDFDPQGTVAATGLSWYDLEQEFKQVPGIVLVILDTCHSGAALSSGTRGALLGAMDRSIDRAVRQLSEAGVEGTVVFASSLSGQLSQERPDWGHGALTLAVLEGLSGKTLLPDGHAAPALPQPGPDGLLSLEQLRNYAVGRVNLISHGQQRVISRNTVDLLGISLGIVSPTP